MKKGLLIIALLASAFAFSQVDSTQKNASKKAVPKKAIATIDSSAIPVLSNSDISTFVREYIGTVQATKQGLVVVAKGEFLKALSASRNLSNDSYTEVEAAVTQLLIPALQEYFLIALERERKKWIQPK